MILAGFVYRRRSPHAQCTEIGPADPDAVETCDVFSPFKSASTACIRLSSFAETCYDSVVIGAKVKSILREVGQRLADIQSLNIVACERAFNCKLRRDNAKPTQYWGTCPDLHIDVLDVRIGRSGGVIVARFIRSAQPALIEELRSLGEPEDIDIVSPPLSPATAPAWSRTWSVAHTISGARIWYSVEESDGDELLVSASRKFTMGSPE